MSTYHLDDDDLFLRCLKVGEIRIRRITNPGKVVGDWKEYKIVKIGEDKLKVYDVEISGSRLKKLEADLKKYKMYVNRQGYCYVSIPYNNGTPHRMNDFFNWSKYGVVPKISTIWSRCELSTNTIVIDYVKKEKEFADMERKLRRSTEKLQLKDHDLIGKDEQLRQKNAKLKDRDRQLENMNRKLQCLTKELRDLIEKNKSIAEKNK